MPSSRHVAMFAAVFVAVVAGFSAISHADRRAATPQREVDGARYRVSAAEAHRVGAAVLTPAIVRRGFTYVRTDPSWQREIAATIATARPEARRLIGLVDGLVTITVDSTHMPGVVGLTTSTSLSPGYQVIVDLPLMQLHFGQRGVARDLFHELGHVIDHAIVPAAMDDQLAAGIPLGYGCDEGIGGACANRDERFAESFAKWAMNDIGVDLDVGYKVMPPEPSLDTWGAPLATLR